jgi:murein DD-endopeptidase MepM/ murein hydrolase activator NlpD
MRSPRYTILIANQHSGTVRRFSLVRRPVILGCLGLLMLPTLVGLGAHWATRGELDALRVSNDTLRVENDSYRTATGELASQISSLETALTELSDKAQIDPAARQALEKLPAVVRSRAMGGSMASAGPVAGVGAQAPPDGTFSILHDLLGVMDERLKSVRSGVEARQALAAATPSIWPLAGWLSSAFGPRADPFTGGPDFHPGLDISADRGTPVHATADGMVESAAYSGNYGNCILISHGFGISTRFGHLSAYAVRPGQKIKRGDVIGFVGSTGRTTAPHLHYEILLNGQPINPLRLLTR